MKLARMLGAALLAALPLTGQSVLDAPNEPAPLEREAIPQNERDFPLHYLLRTHRYDAVLDLLPIVADLNELDHEGRTLLTIAAKDESADAYDMVKALIERGADPKQQDGRGNTALYYAARAGTLAVVELLVDRYGADVNRPSTDPETGEPLDFSTPLLSAAHGGRLRIIRFLESRGAEAAADYLPVARMSARYQDHFEEMTDHLDDPPPNMTEDEFIRARRVASEKAMIQAMRDLGAPEEILEHHRQLNQAMRGIRDLEPDVSFSDAYSRAEAEVLKNTDREAYLKAVKRWSAILGSTQ